MFYQMRSRFSRLPILLLAITVLVSATAPVVLDNGAQAQAAPSALQAAGTIAYVGVSGAEIRLIEADGANDRLLWQAPNPALHRITAIDWSPDGTWLAFASDHESTCSLYRSDIYTIKPDGSDLRRVTNGPACAGLAGYPKGSVTIDVENRLTESLFLLYIEGAANAVELPIGPGARQQITVDNVADFGDGVEQRVVLFQTEQNSWLYPAALVDVLPDATAVAEEFIISGSSVHYGAYSPSWRRDNQAIGYTLGASGAYQASANAGAGDQGESLFPGGSIFGSTAALSPVDDQVLLYHYPFIGLGTAGDHESVASILELSGNLYGLDWLPDGSGLVAGEVLGLGNTHANIWRYVLGSDQPVNLTSFSDENRGFAADPRMSPDGAQLVFIYAPTIDADAELQIMDQDGANVRSLGVTGLYPDWGTPSQGNQPTPTPSPTTTATPPTATPVPTPDPEEVAGRMYLPYVQR
jgi:hypothetical protein